MLGPVWSVSQLELELIKTKTTTNTFNFTSVGQKITTELHTKIEDIDSTEMVLILIR